MGDADCTSKNICITEESIIAEGEQWVEDGKKVCLNADATAVKTARLTKCIATRLKVFAVQKKLQVLRNQVVVRTEKPADARLRALQQPPLLQFFPRKYLTF